MLLQRRRDRVHPMRRAEEIFETASWHNILDPHRNHRNAAIHRAFDFTRNVTGLISARGQHDHHRLRAVDSFDNGARPIGAGPNVPRCAPTTQPATFQMRDYCVRGNFVLGRVTNENIVAHRHGGYPRPPRNPRMGSNQGNPGANLAHFNHELTRMNTNHQMIFLRPGSTGRWPVGAGCQPARTFQGTNLGKPR